MLGIALNTTDSVIALVKLTEGSQVFNNNCTKIFTVKIKAKKELFSV